MALLLTIENGPYEGLRNAEVRRRLNAMLSLLQLQKAELSVVLTDDTQIKLLNKTYRGFNRPTDVLSFSQREGEFSAQAGALLGDIIVSVPTAQKQAAQKRWGLLDEVTMLLAHGLLHLLGWDHDTPTKDRRMKKETERLCEAAQKPPRAKPAKRKKI